MIKVHTQIVLAAGIFLSSAAFAVDQCNNTAQCRAIYGNVATDCRDSKSETSVCMCGDSACESSPVQSPSKVQNIPGRIEAEDYDNGGEGLAFSDSTLTNLSGAYREDAVDIELTSDSGGGHNLSHTDDGEWLEYTLRNVRAGVYTIRMRVAARQRAGGKSISLSLNGRTLGTARVPGTGGWQNWRTIRLRNVNVSGGGNQVLRVAINGGRFNLNWIEFEETGNPPPVTPTPTATPTATPVPPTGRRIAITSDGNAVDRDDICASAYALGMIARSGNANQLVHYTYNDHIWERMHVDNMQRQHHTSVVGTIRRADGALDHVATFDAHDDTEASVSHLAAEMNRSTARSPLVIAMAGRTQVLGLALRRANRSALQHVTVISHSGRNQDFAEENFNGISWREVRNSGANVVEIRNQNLDTKQPYSQYSALNNSGDELVQWVWDRCNVMGVDTFDPSDAGMTYYILNDSDQRANPRKLVRALTQNNQTPTPPPSGSTQFEERDGLVVMEAESTQSTLDRWQMQGEIGNHTGPGYLEFTGNRPSNGPATSPLRYTFKVNRSGNYYLHLRAARETIDGRSDVANDAFVRLEGSYGAGSRVGNNHGNDAPLEVLRTDTKFFGGDDGRFVWTNGARLDLGGHQNKRVAVYNLRAGETYTFVISGRSQHFKVDRIVFRHQSVPTNQAFSLSNQETL